MISVYHYMSVAAILFAMGTYGVLTRRNAIVIFMCIELMLNSVNLTFISLSHHLQSLDGQIFVFFVMAVAAAEAVGSHPNCHSTGGVRHVDVTRLARRWPLGPTGLV